MKISVRYIFFLIVLVLLVALRLIDFSGIGASVSEFRGASVEPDDFSSVMAAQINNGDIELNVGSKTYTSKNDGLFANADAQIMMPIYILRDAMGCSARVYDEVELRIHKRQQEISLILGEDDCFSKVGNDYYVCANEMAKLLDYDWKWDFSNEAGELEDRQADISGLPIRFDLREQKRVSRVRDQGDLGTCWAFGTLLALESSLLPEERYEFAADHMSLSGGYGDDQNEGGAYTMSMAYLTSWKGPVLEEYDPYGDGVTNDSLVPEKHVQEIQILDSGDIGAIKSAIFKYGGVQTSMYNTIDDEEDSENPYYNPDTYAYCYQGGEKPNHDIVIVGWDDTFSADNFKNPPEENGAFICQNSWGPSFGENGYFYVSYYDSQISIHNIVYTRVEDTDNYDRIYQVDERGCIGQIGYEKESIYAANVFTADTDEVLRATGFYATTAGTSYEVYVIKDFEGTASLGEENRIRVGEGTLTNAGYYTIDFDKDVELAAGERFAVMLYIESPGSFHPMAVEYQGSAFSVKVDITDGEGYISMNGMSWNRVEDYAQGNLCIKAYSDNR